VIKNTITSFSKKYIEIISKNELMALGAQVTYFMILAFFPMLIFLLTLLSYTPFANSEVLFSLSYLLPEETYLMVSKAVYEIIESRSPTLLSFGMAASLWASLNGVNALMHGINKAYGLKETRSYLKLKGLSILFLFFLVISIILTLLLLVWGETLGNLLFNFLGAESIFPLLWEKLRLIFQFIVMIITFIMLNKMGTTAYLTIKEVFPGSLFSAIGWLIISHGFSIYIKNFANISIAYGSIGGIIILLLWLYWSSEILLMGCALNGTILSWKKTKP